MYLSVPHGPFTASFLKLKKISNRRTFARNLKFFLVMFGIGSIIIVKIKEQKFLFNGKIFVTKTQDDNVSQLYGKLCMLNKNLLFFILP